MNFFLKTGDTWNLSDFNETWDHLDKRLTI